MKLMKSVLMGMLLTFAAAVSAEVNVNTASAEELQSLSGVGEVKAGAIIEYREAHDGFETAEELTSVDGIGEKTLEAIRDDVTVGEDD